MLAVGRNCVDHLMVVDQFPKEDRKIAFEGNIKEGGGQGGTAACCIAKLGGRVALVGTIGNDARGDFCQQRLEAHGVSGRFLRVISGGTTPLAYIFVTRQSGKRTIFYEPGRLAALAWDPPLRKLFACSKVALLAPDVTYLADFWENKGRPDTQIVYDAERWRKGLPAMMKMADHFVACSDFLQAAELGLHGLALSEQIQRLQTSVGGQLVLTCAAKGAYFLWQEKIWQVPAPEVAVVDTTGAGDNFHAAYSLAVAREKTIPEAVRYAVAVASLSCTEYGGRAGLPDDATAHQFAAKLPLQLVEG